MPKYTIHLGCFQRFACTVEVEGQTVGDACDKAHKRLPASPSDWDELDESPVFVVGVVADNDTVLGMNCRVPSEERESRVLMHMLSEAVVDEDQKDGR